MGDGSPLTVGERPSSNKDLRGNVVFRSIRSDTLFHWHLANVPNLLYCECRLLGDRYHHFNAWRWGETSKSA